MWRRLFPFGQNWSVYVSASLWLCVNVTWSSFTLLNICLNCGIIMSFQITEFFGFQLMICWDEGLTNVRYNLSNCYWNFVVTLGNLFCSFCTNLSSSLYCSWDDCANSLEVPTDTSGGCSLYIFALLPSLCLDCVQVCHLQGFFNF